MESGKRREKHITDPSVVVVDGGEEPALSL